MRMCRINIFILNSFIIIAVMSCGDVTADGQLETDNSVTSEDPNIETMEKISGHNRKTLKVSKQSLLGDFVGYLSVDKMLYDFGEAYPDQEIVGYYVLTNIGSRSLEIKEVRNSCDCATSNLTSQQLDPSESTTLRVAYRVGKSFGKVSKSVSVISEPPAQPEVLKLRLNATVKKYIESVPDKLEIKLIASFCCGRAEIWKFNFAEFHCFVMVV